MLSYEELVDWLEDAWIAAGLHDHVLIESIQPDTLDRGYRADLFPEHPEPLTEQTMPPWVELNFSWSAAHQLRSEGRNLETDSLALVWNYMVLVQGDMSQHSDQQLVRMFQRAVHTALGHFYPNESDNMGDVAVEVRRVYQSDRNQVQQAYVQLVSTNITDLSNQWVEQDPSSLRRMIRLELQLASTVIHALEDIFKPGKNGGYRSVDTA